MIMIITASILNPIDVENKPLSIIIAFSLILYPSKNETITIRKILKMKTIPILSINGKAGNRNLKANDKTNVPIAAVKAPFEVARFQNIPIRKMASAPGLTKPVNS